MTLRYDLRINQGETFRWTYTMLDDEGNGDPALLSGATAKAQIRTHAASPALLYEWSAAHGNLAYDVNTIVLTTPSVDSSLWTFRTGVWALELAHADGVTDRLAEGLVIVHPEIVRP